MNEPWLRDGERKCQNGPQQQGVYNIIVSNLMLDNVKQWNMELLRDLFDYTTIEDIIQVPLVEEVTEDRLVWKEEENGCYSVRSGYRMWRNMRGKSGNSEVPRIWSNVWGIKAPPRVKHLIWRICHDCLPTRSRLRQHHVQCPDVKSFFGDICDKEDSNIVGRVAVMMDVIWRNINDFIWNDEKEEASKLGWLGFHKWQEWFEAQKHVGVDSGQHHEIHWIPPLSGQNKCNVDAGFNNICGTSNRGWCFRNSSGDFLVAGVAWDPGKLSIIEAEAIALKEAIQQAITMNMDQVIFESDSLRVVQAVKAKITGVSELSTIIKLIQSLLDNYPNFEVGFVMRQVNIVAHWLVKAANSWARRSC
ncbi:uncharacterized protein LOC131648950 [Vicia villosa]|uniref:uncharacterized protein LOC131648950 n=1 Tax=Vicia villosa TaxID=3911 RepID=UPI00273AA40C|nr:uncharacterized protein LOC131648950 [Vicia villosa]